MGLELVVTGKGYAHLRLLLDWGLGEDLDGHAHYGIAVAGQGDFLHVLSFEHFLTQVVLHVHEVVYGLDVALKL